MTELIENMMKTMGTQAPRLLGALAILLIGWIVALIVRAGIAKLLKRTSLDKKLSGFLGGEKSPTIEAILSSAAYYIVLLLAGVAALDALGLRAVASPLNQLTGQVLGYLPKIGGAALLLVVAWVLAKGCRSLVVLALERSGLDQKLGGQVGEDSFPVSKTLGDVCYWLIFLFFLPGLLSVLGLEGLLQPVRLMMDRFLEFLPRLFAAGVLLVTGWIAAKIIQNIVVGICSATGFDKAAERIGVTTALGKTSVSKSIGTVVFTLILLPAVVAALDALQMHAVTEPVKGLLQDFVDLVPALFGAFLVLAIAHVVGKWLRPLIAQVLASFGFDRIPELLGFGDEGESLELSSLAGRLFYIALMVLAALEATRVIGLFAITNAMNELGAAVVQVMVGCLIFGLGLYLARVASNAIKSSEMNQANLVASLARAGVLFLTGAMALRRMGLADEIIETAFSLLLGAVAVAIALAFGLGGRDAAGKRVETWFEAFESKE